MKFQKVKVHESPYWEGCDAIWAEIDGVETHVSYEQVANAGLIGMTDEEAERCDGLERLLLPDGRIATVQSIDLDYMNEEVTQ